MIQITSPTIASYFNFFSNLLFKTAGMGAIATYLSLFLAFVVFTIILFLIIVVFSYLFGWFERKIIARIQSRRGPTYVGKYGLLQNLADIIKLLSKENIIPKNADPILFKISIPVLVALFILMLAFVPLTSSFVGIGSTISLLVVFAILFFTPFITFLAGWSSGNKFASIGAQRSVLMMLSYGVPLLLVIASVGMLSQSYSLTAIVAAQSHGWFIVLMPIGFIIFLLVMLAETERSPFDLKDADSELVAGWLTDFSAPQYSLALLLDYVRMFFGSAIIAILFLGGWAGPSIIPQFGWLMIKMLVVAFLIILIRSFMVRIRIDKLLRLGWVYLFPLAVLNLIITFVLFIR